MYMHSEILSPLTEYAANITTVYNASLYIMQIKATKQS